MGIIAACTPALKPLVGGFLKLTASTSDRYKDSGDGHSKTKGILTIGSIPSKGYTKQNSKHVVFYLEERDPQQDDDEYYMTSIQSQTAGAYLYHAGGEMESGQGTGSQESILRKIGSKKGNGIVRTTEVSVSY